MLTEPPPLPWLAPELPPVVAVPPEEPDVGPTDVHVEVVGEQVVPVLPPCEPLVPLLPVPPGPVDVVVPSSGAPPSWPVDPFCVPVELEPGLEYGGVEPAS